MAVPKTDVNLTALYSELNKFGKNGDYSRAIKVAKKILQEAPDEVNAQNCLVVCYIQESDFKNGLSTINKNAALSDSMTFEKAYCLYRLNRTQESLAVLNKENNPEAKHKELKAQVLYRMERFVECLELYKDLIKNTQDDYEAERETNLSAVVASLSLEGTKTSLPMSRDDSYELSYNESIRLLGEGKNAEAEAQLRKAETLCRKSLEEDGATEEEIEDELALIRVQLGYATQLQGRTSESQQMYQMVLKQKPSDVALSAIASNNSAVINGAQNIFDSRRKLKMTRSTVEENEAKFTTRQKQALAVNQCLFLGATSQAEQCRKAIEELKKDYPEGIIEVLLLQATLEFKANRLEEALATLASSKPDSALTAGLAALQLLLEKREFDRAITHLEQLLKQHFRLGLLGSLVSLHSARGQRDKAISLVNEALDKFNKTKADNQVKLLRQAAAFHLKGGEPEKAAACLEQLWKLDSNDTATLARLVLLYSQFDPATAQKKSQQLPPLALDAGVGALDVDALESATWALGLKHARKGPPTGGPTSPGSIGSKKLDEKALAKKKLKKRKKLPKRYDPKVTPDPERWLPRRERSTYRPKKQRDRRYRDARPDVGKGTQGSSAAMQEAENKFDMSNVKASAKPAAAAASSPTTKSIPAATSQRSKPGQGQKKKKRSGKF
ncbi:signal recognition particle subunit SRP72-like [Daphnia pulicaria]|uniref:signal recognition particle subunit SRP72-like n=1 Tax=Daphnia pulicaria TaxID=35523 RepID=UPI001EEAA3D7|nr:signal recognition particle subunit SRP72-like [Daphnia pulicaria]